MSIEIMSIEKWYEVRGSDCYLYRTKGDGVWWMSVRGMWRRVSYCADIEEAFRSKILEDAVIARKDILSKLE